MTQQTKVVLQMPLPGDMTHNVRLFLFNNDLLVLAQVLSVEDGIVRVVLPFEVIAYRGEEGDSILAYEFSPYLENLREFSVKELVPVALNLNHVVSCTMPTYHLLRNYYAFLLYMKRVQDDLDGAPEEESKTIH